MKLRAQWAYSGDPHAVALNDGTDECQRSVGGVFEGNGNKTQNKARVGDVRSTCYMCHFFSFIGVFSPGLVGEGVVVDSEVVVVVFSPGLVGEGVVVRSAVVVSGSCACVDK